MTSLGRARSALVVALAVAVTVAVGGTACSKKPTPSHAPAPELTGLAAVPATAEVVIGADIAKLSSSQVIDHAIEQLLLRDAAVAERWGRLRDDCKINVAQQVKRIMLAIGPPSPATGSGKPGTGPVLMVVVGSIPEDD